jgi:hypothetical protein
LFLKGCGGTANWKETSTAGALFGAVESSRSFVLIPTTRASGETETMREEMPRSVKVRLRIVARTRKSPIPAPAKAPGASIVISYSPVPGWAVEIVPPMGLAPLTRAATELRRPRATRVSWATEAVVQERRSPARAGRSLVFMLGGFVFGFRGAF